MDFLQSIVAFIVALGVLITFHEYGHYWVARRCNVKILRFSIGFGRPIYKKIFGPDNTEFVIAALPLGGYVKMLDEREGKVEDSELSRSFNQQSLSKRFAIVSAGPIFNFIFAIFAYWLVFVSGVSGLKPLLGEIKEDSISDKAGLVAGQEIISINNMMTPTWSSLIDKLVNSTVNGELVSIVVKDENGIHQSIELDLSQVSIDEMAEGKLLDTLGMSVIKLKLPAILGEIQSGGAAEKAGLLQEDEIISVDGLAIDSWSDWVKVIRSNPGKPLQVVLIRSNSQLNIEMIPDRVDVDGEIIGRIGATVSQPEGMFDEYFAIERYSMYSALFKSIVKTWDMSILTLKILGKMLIGEASVKNLSGPISIAQYAGISAGIGIAAFLSFMAIVSISLGVLNLLPVPLLDGGHLLYYLVELVIGKPVSESAQVFGQQIGLVLLLGLMSIAFYNDIARLIG